MACRIEPLESRIVLSVTGTVVVTGGETRLDLTGDNGNDDYVIGVNAGNNLTHTFPTGTGAGKFESNEDFDSSVAGVQKVPAGANTFVNITDSAGQDKLDFSGFSGPVDIRGGKPASSVSSGSGGFTFTGIETLVGTDKNDTIRVNPGEGETFTVLGGAGDDTIIAAGDGDVSIGGGDGKDSIEANNKKGSATVDAGAGDDTVTVRSDKASVQGGKDNDTLIGKSDKNAQGITLDGGDGNDTIRGGKAKETLLGGTGDDSVTGGGNDSCDGGEGKDDVNGVIGRNTITGGAGSDQLAGGRDTTLIERGNGVLVLSQNTLTIDDGKISESDTLTGISRVQLEAGAGNDKLDASAFNGFLTLIGGPGDDIMIGGTREVTFNGGAGDDQITGNSKNDIFFAGLDNAGPLVLLGDDFFTDSGGSDVLSGIDGANLQNLDDIGRTMDASSVVLFPVTMQGGAGQDIMTGGRRPDRISALDGNDTIFISPGNDIVSGGKDSDLFSAESSTGEVKIRFSKERGTVSSTFVDTGGDKIKFRNSISDFENFSGSKLDDNITVNAPSKIDFGVQGNGGNDKMTGTGAGGLFLFGGEGNDVINSRQSFGGADGGGGDDKITATSRFGILLAGGAGKDLIVAGPGDDLITVGDNEVDTVDGGAGKDKLLSSDPDDVVRNVE